MVLHLVLDAGLHVLGSIALVARGPDFILSIADRASVLVGKQPIIFQTAEFL